MSNRRKQVLYKNVTQAQFDDALAEYATANAAADNITSKMDQRITKIRDQYAEKLSTLTDTQNENFNIIMSYCDEHPEIFDKKKSIETVHGKVGYRTGTPKLKLKRGTTWAKALELIKQHLPTYVRSKEEPSKDKLLADREHDGMAEKFKKCHLVIDNDERFFIDLKKEDAEASA